MTKSAFIFVFTFVVFSVSFNSFGQNSTRITISDKHKAKIENETDPRKKLALYRKFYSKDSLNYLKKLDKYLQKQSDSIYKSTQSAKNKISNQLQNQHTQEAMEVAGVNDPTTKLQGWTKKMPSYDQLKTKLPSNQSLLEKTSLSDDQLDTSKFKELKKEGTDKGKSFKEEITPYQQYYDQYKDYLNHPDSVKVMARKIAEKEFAKLPEKMAGSEHVSNAMREFKQRAAMAEELKNIPLKQQEQLKQLGDTAYWKNEGKKIASELAADFLTKNNQLIEATRKKMTRLKKLYSTVGNSNDESSMIKRNSLKGFPLKDRLYLGGNFQIIALKPVSVDISPTIGYRWNKKLIIGVGGIYRQTFGSFDSVGIDLPDQQIGYQAFAQYDAIKSFFASFTFENTRRDVTNDNSDQAHPTWVPGLMLGVGKNLQFFNRVNAQFIVQYNLLHETGRSSYRSPWMVKTGFYLAK